MASHPSRATSLNPKSNPNPSLDPNPSLNPNPTHSKHWFLRGVVQLLLPRPAQTTTDSIPHFSNTPPTMNLSNLTRPLHRSSLSLSLSPSIFSLPIRRPHLSSNPRRKLHNALSYHRAGEKVVVAVSGGVDSSVAALLARDRVGAENVVGMYMRNWDGADEAGETLQCSTAADLRSARDVCSELGIAFQCMDFEKEYWTMVFEPFLQDLQYRGTPNPDVFCNRWIKFDAALNRVRKVFGSEAIFVTGHHAQIEMRIASNADGLTLCHGRKDPVYLLREAVDKRKDQSYFLSCVPGEALRKVAFPVGCMEKSEVRRIAADNKLSTAYRKDSVGICFVGKRNFGSFLDGYIDMKPGRIVNVDDGKTIGVHQGLHRFTIGQNARLSGRSQKAFVVHKDMASNVVYVADGESHPALFSSGLLVSAKEMFWINGLPSDATLAHLECRIRYNQDKIRCSVHLCSDGQLMVSFDKPEKVSMSRQV